MFMWLMTTTTALRSSTSSGTIWRNGAAVAAATASSSLPGLSQWTAAGTLFMWLIMATTGLMFLLIILNIVAPIITNQPASQTIPFDANVTFSVGVIGAAPFAYQWSSNNIAVPGATNATFTLTNVNLSASGNYSVLVTNSYGSVLSSNALLDRFASPGDDTACQRPFRHRRGAERFGNGRPE